MYVYWCVGLSFVNSSDLYDLFYDFGVYAWWAVGIDVWILFDLWCYGGHTWMHRVETDAWINLWNTIKSCENLRNIVT